MNIVAAKQTSGGPYIKAFDLGQRSHLLRKYAKKIDYQDGGRDALEDDEDDDYGALPQENELVDFAADGGFSVAETTANAIDFSPSNTIVDNNTPILIANETETEAKQVVGNAMNAKRL